MRIALLNPNTTASMTAKIAAAARAVAAPGTEILAANPAAGPASIEGYLDIANCLPGLLAEAERHRDCDAVVVACFDDTGVDALRCALDIPVIGIGEAAYHAASLISARFSVITTLSKSVAGLEDNLLRYGLARKCARVRATELPVLQLEAGDPATLERIRAEISAAVSEDRAEAIVLGCAGMADLMQALSAEFCLPVIDGVACGVSLAQALVNAGLRTSKINSYRAG